MRKNIVRVALVLLIIVMMFSIVAFLMPVEKEAAFWLAYLFFLISVLMQAYTLFSAYTGTTSRSRFYGFPIGRVGTIYMLAQIMVSMVFIALADYVHPALVAVVCAVMLAVAMMGTITTEAVREEIERQDAKLARDVALMRSLQSKVRILADSCEDASCAAQLRAFSEELRYSDPVSGDKLALIEGELAELVDELQAAMLQMDYTGAAQLTRRAKIVLAERNRLCKLNK